MPRNHVDNLLPCQAVQGDMFFSPQPDEIARAKAACAGCPVLAACLRRAVERAEPCGVWGGELFLHGRPVAALPRRGRPRRRAAA